MKEIFDGTKATEITDGVLFFTKLSDTLVKGVIAVERGTAYLLQDYSSGSHPPSGTRGYKYAWQISDDSGEIDLSNNSIDVLFEVSQEEYDNKDLELPSSDKRYGYVGEVFGYNVYAKSSRYDFGCGAVAFNRDVITQFLQGMLEYIPKCQSSREEQENLLKPLKEERSKLYEQIYKLDAQIDEVSSKTSLRGIRNSISNKNPGFREVDKELGRRDLDACSLTIPQLTTLFTEEMNEVNKQEA